MTCQRLIFIAPLSAMRKRTRLAKMAHYLEKCEVPLLFLGWERDKGECERLKWKGRFIDEKPILRGGGYASKIARLMYPIWMMAVFFKCLIMPRGSVVWCLGWETAFPARLAAVFKHLNIVFDDADRFSMLIKLPHPIQALLVKFEKWTSLKCMFHIIPGWTRYEWRHDRMVLLRNSPLCTDYQEALKIPRHKQESDITLYVNGWIAWDTGAKIVLKALDILKKRGVVCRVIVAGRIASDEGRALVEREEVELLGELSQCKALELYRACDVALTLYDPSVPINRHAESNKWGDCVFLGTPFIVNEEVQTAEKFVKAGAALTFQYNDHEALADIIQSLANDSNILLDLREKLDNFKIDYMPFEDQLDKIFPKILSTISADEFND